MITVVPGVIISIMLAALPPEARCLALNVYWEAAIARQDQAGMQMVAHVTLARAADNRPDWGGQTICGVVYKKDKGVQFSWTTNPNTFIRPHNAVVFLRSAKVAEDALLGRLAIPSDLRAARYYLNPKTSKRVGMCWFASHLVRMRAVGDHVFYRQPTDAEKAKWHKQHRSLACATHRHPWHVRKQWHRRHHRY